MRSRCWWLLLFASLSCGTAANAQTRAFLDAPVATNRIRVQWDASDKQMQWAIDDGTHFRQIQTDDLFLTKRSVFVTYPRLNPLKIQATAAVVVVDDPAQAVLTKLIDSLTGVATLLRPPSDVSTAALFKASECPDLNRLFADLYGTTTSPENVKTEYKAWSKAIDDGLSKHTNGSLAVRDAIALMTQDGGLLKTLDIILRRAPETLERIEKEARATDGTPSCDRNLLKVLLFTNPRERIQQVQALRDAVAQLVELLRTRYAVDTKWDGLDYKISEEIRPTADKMRNITVKVVNLSAKVDEISSSLTVAQQDAGSATFTVRRYAAFTPEIGVGAVFGFVERPKYGTAKNAAGETIVARVPDDRLSIQPSVLVNFVCRCSAGAFAPMLQVGASTSKDLPGVLLGGGLRLFGAGRGDVAIGGGLMFAWIKDLQKLKEGDVIGGTKDIEADLGYATRPKAEGYFVIQYKF